MLSIIIPTVSATWGTGAIILSVREYRRSARRIDLAWSARVARRA